MTTQMKTMVTAINEALHLAMAADDRVVVMGEDVGLNGGVFRVTDGLFATYGENRV
jgi:pyruvate/2-oxoglutarate/acetoin dehydrogenase E1 component